MNENDFSRQLTDYLDRGTASIDSRLAARLVTARERTLSSYRAPISIFGLVTVSGQVTNPAWLIRKPLFWLPILALAVAVWFAQSTQPDDIYDDAGLIDAKLLTGELPIDAFLDQDFATWVKEADPQ